MSSRWWLAVLIGGLAAAAAAAPAAQDPGDGSTGGGPPPPPPRADPSAGRPAYLADFEDLRSMVLDARGRVVRVLPRRVAAGARACPGGRRIADAGEWSGVVQVHTPGGKRRWRRRIPIAYVGGLSCLDARGTRVAVVTESESRPVFTLRVVSRRGSRVVLRTRGQIPLLTRELAYQSDRSGVHLRCWRTGARSATSPPRRRRTSCCRHRTGGGWPSRTSTTPSRTARSSSTSRRATSAGSRSPA